MDRDWPLVHSAVIQYFNSLSSPRASSQTPPELEKRLADEHEWVRVRKGPGSEREEEEQQVVDFDCFAPTEADAWQLALRVRRMVLAMHNSTISGVHVDTVTTEVVPTESDWSPAVYRIVYSARFTLRRRPI